MQAPWMIERLGDVHGASTEASEFLNHKDSARFARSCSKSADVPRQLVLGSLRMSVNVQTALKPFPCPLCSLTLTSQKYLTNHLSKCHDGATFSPEVYTKYAEDHNRVICQRLEVCRALNDVKKQLKDNIARYNTTKREQRATRALSAEST